MKSQLEVDRMFFLDVIDNLAKDAARDVREGYPPVSIRTPEEVVRYEE